MRKTHTTHWEKGNFRKGYLVLVNDNPFLEQTPLLWENCEPPCWENFENQTPFYKVGGSNNVESKKC